MEANIGKWYFIFSNNEHVSIKIDDIDSESGDCEKL